MTIILSSNNYIHLSGNIMFKLLIIFLLGVGSYSGCGQADSLKKDIVLSDTGLLVDPVEVMPFIIERENQYIQLPDSLGGNILSGLAFLTLYIGEDAKVQKFTIIRLDLRQGEKEIVDYLNTKSGSSIKENDYPDEIKKYYKFFVGYIESLKIVPVPDSKPRELTLMNLLIRFK